MFNNGHLLNMARWFISNKYHLLNIKQMKMTMNAHLLSRNSFSSLRKPNSHLTHAPRWRCPH